MLGSIRQELLSGVRDAKQFERLCEHLRPFPDVAITTEDHENAARHFNSCRAKGVQGSNTDFLICAVSVGHRTPILTTDKDFQHYARVLPVQLHAPRALG